MTQAKKRIFASVILIILIVVPFLDWKLGAVLWMCAWLVFIFQNLYTGRSWKTGEDTDREDEHE